MYSVEENKIKLMLVYYNEKLYQNMKNISTRILSTGESGRGEEVHGIGDGGGRSVRQPCLPTG